MFISNKVIKFLLWLLLALILFGFLAVFKFGVVAKFENLVGGHGSGSSTVLSGNGVSLSTEDVIILYLVVGSLLGLAAIGWFMSSPVVRRHKK